eukprot:SAG31_NODE_49_length_30599_cov_15.615016_32_plen_67_part_00
MPMDSVLKLVIAAAYNCLHSGRDVEFCILLEDIYQYKGSTERYWGQRMSQSTSAGVRWLAAVGWDC